MKKVTKLYQLIGLLILSSQTLPGALNTSASTTSMKVYKEGAEKIRLIQHFAMRLAERDPDEALAWAEAIGNEKEIAAAMGQIALVLAETDPHRAANLLSEFGVDGHGFDVGVVQVLQRWAAKSPPEAAAWVQNFPQGAARKAGIDYVVSKWAYADARAAFSWLSALEQKEVRADALLAMEKSLLKQPPAMRDAWLLHASAQIKKELEAQRQQAMEEIGDNVSSEPQPDGK